MSRRVLNQKRAFAEAFNAAAPPPPAPIPVEQQLAEAKRELGLALTKIASLEQIIAKGKPRAPTQKEIMEALTVMTAARMEQEVPTSRKRAK